MKLHNNLLMSVSLFLLLAASGCASAEKSVARRLMRAEGRAVERQSARRLERGMVRNLERDLERDRASAARRLSREATTFRYTSKAESERELRSGIRAGSHFTSKARPGRPLEARSARARYGLPSVPEVRETVRLQKGTMVRRNRAIGGMRGVGEITSTGKTNGTAIRKVIPLKYN
jgi:hypothetical protein